MVGDDLPYSGGLRQSSVGRELSPEKYAKERERVMKVVGLLCRHLYSLLIVDHLRVKI